MRKFNQPREWERIDSYEEKTSFSLSNIFRMPGRNLIVIMGNTERVRDAFIEYMGNIQESLKDHQEPYDISNLFEDEASDAITGDIANEAIDAVYVEITLSAAQGIKVVAVDEPLAAMDILVMRGMLTPYGLRNYLKIQNCKRVSTAMKRARKIWAEMFASIDDSKESDLWLRKGKAFIREFRSYWPECLLYSSEALCPLVNQ